MYNMHSSIMFSSEKYLKHQFEEFSTHLYSKIQLYIEVDISNKLKINMNILGLFIFYLDPVNTFYIPI